jgi:hypothetical protein
MLFMNTKYNVYIYVLFYSHCYTITIVLSIYTRGTPVIYTFPRGYVKHKMLRTTGIENRSLVPVGNRTVIRRSFSPQPGRHTHGCPAYEGRDNKTNK